MVRALLVRGMLVGLCAGLLAFAFASAFGEAQIGHAIAFESAQARAAGLPAEPELVSRTVQSTIGLAIGTSVYGLAFGGIFALVFAAVYGRVGRMPPRATAALLALAGFVAIVAAPFLKYPANPPSVGQPGTITHRTELYLVMIAISILAAVASARTYRALRGRFGAWNAGIVAALAFVAVVGGAELVMPSVNEVPRAFSATVLWRFRLASLGTQVVLWGTIGLGFGFAAERAMRRAAQSRGQGSSLREAPR